ncbi:MAG TPA: hypothetical protein PL009_07725 [Flavipsychrobacter sp.]|nr:hypothetical protein [Flavipsychrobacter sp.]
MDTHFPPVLRQLMGEERRSGDDYFDKATKEAAAICGRSQGASAAAKETEPINRKERARFSAAVKPAEEEALIAHACESGLWVEEKTFVDKYQSRKIGEGAEQKVFLAEDGVTVLKLNAAIYHYTWLDYFNRLLMHSFLFPATRYDLVGFTLDNGMLAAITRQQFAILDKGASREIIEHHLQTHGFVRIKNDDYYSAKLGVLLEDLHDENIFLYEEQNILFIDPVVYFETKDMNLGGNSVFIFPFK